jgi:hypothetical protein
MLEGNMIIIKKKGTNRTVVRSCDVLRQLAILKKTDLAVSNIRVSAYNHPNNSTNSAPMAEMVLRDCCRKISLRAIAANLFTLLATIIDVAETNMFNENADILNMNPRKPEITTTNEFNKLIERKTSGIRDSSFSAPHSTTRIGSDIILFKYDISNGPKAPGPLLESDDIIFLMYI